MMQAKLDRAPLVPMMDHPKGDASLMHSQEVPQVLLKVKLGFAQQNLGPLSTESA